MVRALHSFLTFMRNVASQWLVVSETEHSQIKCCVAWDEATTPQPPAPDPQADPSHNSVSNEFFTKINYLIQPKRLQLFAFWYRYTTCCLISKKTVSAVEVLFSFCFGFLLFCVEISLMTRVPPLVVFCEVSSPHAVCSDNFERRERERGHWSRRGHEYDLPAKTHWACALETRPAWGLQ